MEDLKIICPNCKTEIKLTESLAAPLVESVKRDYAERESMLRDRERACAKAEETIEDRISQTLKHEREMIAAEEARKARLAIAADLDRRTKEVGELEELLKQKDARLAEAQGAQAEVIKKLRELDDARRELNLTVEKGIQAGLSNARDQACREVEERMKLRVMEREQTIAAMQRQIEELNRRAEQGSQQLQGEVQELELEALLRAKFPRDTIEPVPKGEHGGDVLHHVVGPLGQDCGTILWEAKRTKNWSDSWLTKLRDDQRTAKAEAAIIVSQALPKDVDSFDFREGIWISHPRVALPVAIAIRKTLIEVSMARKAAEGQQTKTDLVYQYINGPSFRQRVQAIVEAFSSMLEDLDKERKVISKQWAKREEQIFLVMQGTVGMYGDIQGIVGNALPEIEGLELRALDAPNGNPPEQASS
jgi:hypothetical protein